MFHRRRRRLGAARALRARASASSAPTSARSAWAAGSRSCCARRERLRERGRRDVVLPARRRRRRARRARARGARAPGSTSVVFTGRLPKARACPALLAASDACLVHLARTRAVQDRDALEDLRGGGDGEADRARRRGLRRRAGRAARGARDLHRARERADAAGRAVLRLAADRELARRLGRAGYERIASRLRLLRAGATSTPRCSRSVLAARGASQ